MEPQAIIKTQATNISENDSYTLNSKPTPPPVPPRLKPKNLHQQCNIAQYKISTQYSDLDEDDNSTFSESSSKSRRRDSTKFFSFRSLRKMNPFK